MDIFFSVFSIIGVLVLGSMSPGPSFVVVARTAVASSRQDGIAVALGLGAGAFIFAFAAIFGLRTLFEIAPWTYSTIKFIGGAYLLFLAYRLWRGAASPLTVSSSPVQSKTRAYFFLFGLGTQLSNPKTALVFSSIFIALLPADAPFFLYYLLPVIAFLVDASWFIIVAYVLSSPASRKIYLCYKIWIDRVAGVALGILGIKMILDR